MHDHDSPDAMRRALEWAVLARQKELANGASFVPTELLEADPVWCSLAAIRRLIDGRR